MKGTSSARKYDIVLMTDMTRLGDIELRLAQEVRAYADFGYRTGLIHIPSPWAGSSISQTVQRCVRERQAEVITPDGPISAKLLLVHAPQGVLHRSVPVPAYLPKIAASRVLLIADQPPRYDPVEKSKLFSLLFGPVSWAPTNRWVRESLEEYGDRIEIEAEDWRALGPPITEPVHPNGARLPVAGRTSAGGQSQWPDSADELLSIYPGDGTFDVRLAGLPTRNLPNLPADWKVFGHGEIAIERFLSRLDFFVYYPGPDAIELPDAAIAFCVAAGKIVILPPKLRVHFGARALYCKANEAQDAVRRLWSNQGDFEAQQRSAMRQVPLDLLSHRRRIASLVGTPRSAVRQRNRRKSVSHASRTLFLSGNGTGVGHVTRLLAIARRAEHLGEPVFATMAQAVDIIASCGFTAEYLPSMSYTGTDLPSWDAWLRADLEHIIEAYRVGLIIFDGNHPTSGLVKAVASRGDCRLAWIRRGMWGGSSSPFLENARHFDLIIEPGEIAGERDTGERSPLLNQVVQVNPIRLLDDDELLTREEAAAALGLDAARQAVLIQLGAGSNRDLVSLIATILREMEHFPDVQVVVAEWSIGAADLSLWPNVVTLRGFPISQYLRAFDFSFSAAGYNTFHEAIAYQVPTVFIPNANPSMDDQVGRARFSQDESAAFELPENRLYELPQLIEVLLSENARAVLRENCWRLRRCNGANEAVAALATLIESDRIGARL